jgi:hypothetical protein
MKSVEAYDDDNIVTEIKAMPMYTCLCNSLSFISKIIQIL